ncbi:hypothetical protein [Psychrobacter sp. I-STPA10]|uniref:hypothetical protein n=1 Tax=Psychrobacter sp. I-STPA10 TaxID=2585769 RepID=UPI001E4EF6D6|nr:hypothetical protein [Psychrobacter sp. I-STPA10]
MSNKLICPNCHRGHDLSDYINETNAEMAFSIALTVPAPLSSLVLQYTQLFAPLKSKLSLDRRAKIIESLHLEGCDIARVAYGINVMLDNHAKGELKSPIKNHNYLLKVMAGYTPPNISERKKYTLTDKQIKFFGYRLCQDDAFAMSNAKVGESQGEFLTRIEYELKNPDKVKQWYGYINKISQQTEQ